MSVQGHCDIQGTRKCGGDSPAGSPTALEWNNLSAILTIGAPTLNPSGQYVGGSSDATGTTVTIQNTLAGFGLNEEVWWSQGLTAAFLPTWDKTTQQLLIRGTIITRPNSAARMNTGIVFWDNFFTLLNGKGGIYVYSSSAGGDCWYDALTNEGAGDLCTSIPDPSLRMVVAIGKSSSNPEMMGPRNGSTWITNATGFFIAGDPTFLIVAGSKTNTSTGPHTIKILWEYAFLEYAP